MDREATAEEVPAPAAAARTAVGAGGGLATVARCASDGGLATALGRRGVTERAVLARTLSRTVGNRAVSLAIARSPRVLARDEINNPKQYKPWESPSLAAKTYNLDDRDRLLRLFISMFRQFELVDAVPEKRQGAGDAALVAIKAAAAGIDPKTASKADKERLTHLNTLIGIAKYDAPRAAAQWESEQIPGDKLLDEVDRLFGTGEVPAWLRSIVPWFAGMKYVSAHGSWYSARHLLYAMQWVNLGGSVGTKKKIEVPADYVAYLKGLDEAGALRDLRQMRKDGNIPDTAWMKIVSLTNLRLDAEGPASEAIAAAKSSLDPLWDKVLAAWQAGTPAAPWLGETGVRSWMTALKGGNVVFLQTVCNQLAEAAASKRGVSLPGGIAENADYFFVTAGAAGPSSAAAPAGKVAVAPYFRHVKTPDDLRPGANVFFIDSNWVTTKPEAWIAVAYRAGMDYPLANDPGVKKEDKEHWNADWAKTPIPADGAEHGGWTYTLTPGAPVARTNAAGETQWLKWLHQATVMRRLGNRVFTLETVTGGAGFGERSVDSLSTHHIFVGWLPGNDPQFQAAPPPPPPAPDAVPAAAPAG
jgi:hypothetical protein